MMQIKDLFSHKIHSSGDDWPNKLIDIASIFYEFHGKPYDRAAIEKRLSEVSPRASIVARDPSKFRDEISAYPAYLGLFRVELVENRWHIFLSYTARQFLVSEEPNVAAFMLLQLALFQYPNGMGVSFRSNSDSVRIQTNARDRTLSFISDNIHLSPFRLICLGLTADSLIKNIGPLDAELSFSEVLVLANHSTTNCTATPSLQTVQEVLLSCRNGEILAPEKFESRFHILKHTDFLVAERTCIKIRDAMNNADADELLLKLETINSIKTQFSGFDQSTNSNDLLNQVRSCSWGKYFDGVRTIESDKVTVLTDENPAKYTEIQAEVETHLNGPDKATNIYELKPVDFSKTSGKKVTDRNVIYTDPEITKIRRQRANLKHKILLEMLHDHLEKLGATPFENEHIDLFAELPSKDKFVFEVKSITTDNLLSQTRKGLSQLYEYRFRYQDVIGYDVNLFLVYPQKPVVIPWLQEYLYSDRQVGVIWFNGDNQLHASSHREELVTALTG